MNTRWRSVGYIQYIRGMLYFRIKTHSQIVSAQTICLTVGYVGGILAPSCCQSTLEYIFRLPSDSVLNLEISDNVQKLEVIFTRRVVVVVPIFRTCMIQSKMNPCGILIPHSDRPMQRIRFG